MARAPKPSTDNLTNEGSQPESARCFPVVRHQDARGTLAAFDRDSLPFTPVRAFVISDVPAGAVRSGHALSCEEFIWAPVGSCEVTTFWKESRGAADWVIVTAIDEHLHHPSLMRYLASCKSAGITCIPAVGFQMVSNEFPQPDEHLARTRTWGAPDEEFNKLRIFDPDAIRETNYAPGAHSSKIEGRCVLPERDELMLLHYKYLGTEYVRERDPALGRRLGATDRDRHFGFQYFYSDEQYLQLHSERIAQAVDVSDPSYFPWCDHPCPRWWRGPMQGETLSESGAA